MLRLWIAAIILAGSLALPASGQPAADPTGRWMTADNQAVIQIAPCGGKMCGWIVGLAHPNPAPLDWRGHPECGFAMLQTAPGTDQDGNPDWSGTVTDPRNGAVYHATLMLDGLRHLLLRGYLLLPVLGHTQTWLPYAGRTLAGCQLASN